jgi:hypothetical protein
LYRDRADAENVFDELKNQWGWGGFTTQDIARCQLLADAGALIYNWSGVSVSLADANETLGKNSFVTDLAITPDTVADLAACGRARWKIENETFNVIKTNRYNLKHNFGHGKEILANVLVTLNLLAFAFHTAAYLAALAWRAAVAVRGPRYRFFEHLRTITAYVVFRDWPPPAAIHRRGGHTTTLSRRIPRPAINPPGHGAENTEKRERTQNLKLLLGDGWWENFRVAQPLPPAGQGFREPEL